MRHSCRHIYYTVAMLIALAAIMAGCRDESVLPDTDYTVIGMPVRLTVNVSLPEMDVRTRAEISDADLNNVRSLWVATFDTNGEMTTDGWHKVENLNTTDTEIPRTVTIDTKSGPSYIVAVANVEELEIHTASDVTGLDQVKTFDDFLRIAVKVPSTRDLVNAPTTPLPMAGAYTNLVPGGHGTADNPPTPSPDNWQTENFQSYTIPATNSGEYTIGNGAIHLRRLVSQNTFNLIPGPDIKLTPLSYTVVNIPKYSYLYERPAAAKAQGYTLPTSGANFGDRAKDAKDAANFYNTSGIEFTANNMLETEIDGMKGCYTFNFWQGENKHTGDKGKCEEYNDREAQETTPITPVGGQTVKNTGLFTALTGTSWSSNNLASFVRISCMVEYKTPLDINKKGEKVDSDPDYQVKRSGIATFTIHLGYMGENPKDFNCFRNTKYTYDVTINGVDDIRVEAYDNNKPRHGAEGIVSDITGDTKYLDCHYNAYNIKLEKSEIEAYNKETGSGFCFYIVTYDNLATNGHEKSYSEENFIDFESYDKYIESYPEQRKYIDWVELRPTSDENTLAAYKPREGANSDGRTFNLVDLSKGIINPLESDIRVSDSDWYTVFIKEYTYDSDESDGSDESQFRNEKPQWHSYVFAQPRRFYIRVTKAVSEDGQSIYSRSKYAGTQQSIISYYDREAITESTENGKTRGSAIGVEHTNESFGLGMHKSFNQANDGNNGRLNCWRYTEFQKNNGVWTNVSNPEWTNVLDVNRPQTIKGFSGNNNMDQTIPLPRLKSYIGSINDIVGRHNDPQNSSDIDDYIEAINACMNRNRDNNGDGIIDKNELRWYVPTLSKYLRILIGQEALAPDQIVNYQNLPLNRPSNMDRNAKWGEYLYFSSEGKQLWAMEGYSTSDYQRNNSFRAAPWQVRCIRNLGTNLNEIANIDQTIPAYTFFPNDPSDRKKGGIVKMSYYQTTTMRTNPYTGNGTGNGEMPVHTIAQEYNSLYRYGFEIHDSYITNSNNYDGRINRTSWKDLRDAINDSPESNPNPCTNLNIEGETGWRLPNIKELAIMKNLGVIVNFSPYMLSCSMGIYDNKGKKFITPYSDENNTLYFNSINSTRITQEENGIYNIRCVRDNVKNK